MNNQKTLARRRIFFINQVEVRRHVEGLIVFLLSSAEEQEEAKRIRQLVLMKHHDAHVGKNHFTSVTLLVSFTGKGSRCH